MRRVVCKTYFCERAHTEDDDAYYQPSAPSPRRPSYHRAVLVTTSPILPTTAWAGGAENSDTHLVQGRLRFCHYGLDGLHDHGWGCGYRTVRLSSACACCRRHHFQRLLILDPHYDGPPAGGPAASVEALCKEGWAAWRPLSSCLRAESFYNIALPQRPQPDRLSARAVGVAHGQAAARATLVDAIPAPASASAFARTNADANAEQWGFEVIRGRIQRCELTFPLGGALQCDTFCPLQRQCDKACS